MGSSLRAHILTRLLMTIPMVLILVTLVFVILRVMPGDPALAMLRETASEEQIRNLRHALGLDKPVLFNLRGSAAIARQPSSLYKNPDVDSQALWPIGEGEELRITGWVPSEEGWLWLGVTEHVRGWVRIDDLQIGIWGRIFSTAQAASETDVYADASGSKAIGRLGVGETVNSVRVQGDWAEVIATKQVEGWSPAEQFETRVNPFDSQYFTYLWNLVRGELGTSMTQKRPVRLEIIDRFPATLELAVGGMIITLLIGISTGAFAAHKRRSPLDYGLRIFSIMIYSVPIFWLGLILQMILGVRFGWLPVAGRIGPEMAPRNITGLYTLDSLLTGNIPSLLSAIQYLIMPCLTLGLYLSGVFTRLTRSNMLDVLRQDYITAARARGIPERVVVYKHGLKNAFIPILTMMGLQFAALLAGAVLTETTFSWPGLGNMLVRRIYDRDFSTIQGTIVVFAFLVALVSLIVDVIYAYIDPRIRY
ncbi:MAG: ABC transporter permease [Anaerolineae bacterium]|nr:ABC transporter permease [Anaerolineae bacterium]